MGLFTQLLSFSGLVRCLPKIWKKSCQRTGNSDSRQKKDVLKNILFSNYFMLVVSISLIKFPKIVFAVWNFVRSLKFYHENNFYPSSLAFKINWCALFYFKLNSRKWEIRYVYSRENLQNTATIREVNSTQIDWSFTAKESQDYAPLQRQASNITITCAW